MAKTDAPRIFATFRCNDARALIAWLVDTVGFTERVRIMDDERVGHAELAFGSSMIMLGDDKPDAYGRIAGDPGAGNGGKSLYVAVDDVDALYARVEASGATIEQEPTERDYGSREFICRDPEGNVWCFGTYWPKAADID